MKRLFVLLSFLLPCVSYANPGNNMWRWYYTAFASPEKSAEVFVRSGVASVKQNGGKIEINFREKSVPELAPIMVGHVSNGKVNGVLRKFFMYEEGLVLFGDMRSSQAAKDCGLDEIILRTKVPTGSVLVLSRVTGGCQ